MNLFSVNEIKALLETAGASPKKSLGQNFLIAPSVPDRIAEAAADAPGANILEIGPGVGVLTLALAARYAAVAAVEIDASLLPVLDLTLADADNVSVTNADFMRLHLNDFLDEKFGTGSRAAVAANLPYYITTPIVMRLLEEAGSRIDRVTVMVQSEVADRFTAAPGSPEYGAVTASIAYYGACRRLFSVPRGCFYPAPKVDSAVVSIDLYKTPRYPDTDRVMLMKVIAAAFGQRRKTLVNALSAYFPALSKAECAAALEKLGHRADIRGEKLSTDDFAALAEMIFQ